MPPTRAAAATTDQYRRRLLALRESAALSIAALLTAVDLDLRPAPLSREFERWRARAETVTAAAARQAAALSVAYVDSYLVAAGANPASSPVTPTEPDTSGLSTVRGALFWRLGQRAGRPVAMASATATARRVARESIGRAASSTLAEAVRTEPQVDRWRRVTSGSCCARCAVLASRTYGSAEAFKRHETCRCSHEMIVAGRAETFQRRSPTVVAP